MVYSRAEFHDIHETDIWVLQQMLTLPSDPPTKIENLGSEIRVSVVETISMPAQQRAVQVCRRNLLPAIFVVTQKIYADLFRLVLGNSGRSAGNRQKNVQREVSSLLSSSLVVSPPFLDQPEFLDWWAGRFDFDKLRLARNQIEHDKYSFDGTELLVKKNDRTILLQWKESDIFEFAQLVLSKGRTI